MEGLCSLRLKQKVTVLGAYAGRRNLTQAARISDHILIDRNKIAYALGSLSVVGLISQILIGRSAALRPAPIIQRIGHATRRQHNQC